MESDEPQSAASPTLWEQNHGNLLLAFVAIIMLFGAGVLIYRQTRFVPPRFPDGDVLHPPAGTPNSARFNRLNESVVIKISGTVNDLGQVRVAVYESEATFNLPDKAALKQTLDLRDGVATWVIPAEKLPEEFAIAAYHDENNDGTLNRNRFGIPTERYGYSRNARGLVGPPPYKEAAEVRPQPGAQVEIFVR